MARATKMRFGVVIFPGSNCDTDAWHALHDGMGQRVDYIWHQQTDLSSYDCVVLPGGFSYGDYLRTGAVARFSPVMKAVADEAEAGKLVLGICNGFQILLRGGAAARGDAAQRGPAVHLQARQCARRVHRHPLQPGDDAGRGAVHAHRPRGGQLPL